MKPIYVLMVDDDRDIGTFMKLKLAREAANFSFAFVEGGRECLEYIRSHDVDCILSDYQMPGMDGMELLKALRELGSDVPFIFLTGQGNEELAREAFKNGAYDYFTKDIGFAHFTRIINSIEQAIRGHESESERRIADEARRQFEQRLLLHVQQTPLGAIEWDVDFCVRSWNPAAENVFGYTADEAMGRHASFIVPENARKHVDRVWSDLLKRKGGERSTNENVTKDGRTIMCEWYNTPLVAENGSVIGVASFVQDVTKRQKAEQALAESEEKFRNLVEKSLVGVYLIQEEESTYVFKYVNSTMAGILDYTVDELTGMDVLETGLPEDMPLVKENLRRRIEGEIQSISYGFRCRKKGGEIIDVMVYGTRIMYMGRSAVIGTLLDITERKKAERALAESEEKFRHLVGQAADAFFLHDINGRIVDVNQQACDSLGYTREELLGMSVLDIEKGLGSGKLADLWRGMTPKRPITAKGIHRRKDGSTFPVEVRVGSLNVGGEQLILALARDVSERVKAEEALRASEKFLETVIETEPECVKLITPDGRLQMMNRAGLDMIQAETLEQVQNKPVSGLVAPEHLKAFMNLGKKVLAGENAYLEFDMIGLKGRRMTLETHMVPLRNDKDEIIAMLGVTRDITEHKKADEALQESEWRLKAILNTMPDIAWLKDIEGRYIAVNEAFSRASGLGLEEAVGKTDPDIWPRDLSERYISDDREVIDSGNRKLIRETMVDKDGNKRLMETIKSPFYDDKGNIIGTVGIARDITGRERE